MFLQALWKLQSICSGDSSFSSSQIRFAVTTPIRGGQVVRLSWLRTRSSCTGTKWSFSQLADSCGGGEALRSEAQRPSSLAPSGRRLPARTPWAFSLRCALPRSRFPGALRPAGPRSGSAQPPHFRGHSLSALGSIWFAARPLRPSQGYGGRLTQPLGFFTGGIRDPARPLIGARAATRAQFSGCLPGASSSGLSWADPERTPRTVVKK